MCRLFYFIKISRGSVVDESALVELLEQYRIKGVLLDIFVDESNEPKEPRSMNHVLQPHCVSGTFEILRVIGC